MSTPNSAAGPSVGHVTVRYWASLRAAAGTEADLVPVSKIATLAEVEMTVLSIHGNSSRFGQLLRTCSVLVGETPMNTGDPAQIQLRPGDVVEFLPPFAGG